MKNFWEFTRSGFVLPSRFEMHFLRKLWHLGTGLVSFFIFQISGASPRDAAAVALGLTLVVFAWEWLRLRMSIINGVTIRFAGPLMRQDEVERISGFPFYTLGMALSLIFFPKNIALLSILFLVVGDPVASTFGILYGKDKLWGNKSFQGAVASMIACSLVTLIYGHFFFHITPVFFIFACLAGMVGALSEACSFKVDDNLTIPLLSGLGLTILNHIFSIL